MTATAKCYDVVVVGAGPAGSATARDIAAEGFRVLLLEEHASVGRPVHCTGLVSLRALGLAKVDDGVVLNEISRAVVRFPSGRELAIGDNSIRAVVVDRERLDRALAEQALNQGAELLLDTRFLAFEPHGRWLRIQGETSGRSRTFLAPLLVGADGARSRVARQLGLGSLRNTVVGVSAEVRAKQVDLGEVTVLIERNLAPGWFAWLVPAGDGRVRIGTGALDGSRPADLLQLLARRFPQYFQDGRILSLAAGQIPLWSPALIFAPNVLLVGDAARQVKPTSGGGIYTGLVGAKHAAHTAAEALRREDFSRAFLRNYQRAFMAELGDELRRGLDIHRAFARLPNAGLNRLLTILGRDDLRETLCRWGDIDHPSRAFYEAVKKAPMLAAFVRWPLRFPTAWLPWRQRWPE